MSLIGRFKSGSEIFYGAVDGGRVIRFEAAGRRRARTYELKKLKTLVPAEPTKIIAVGLNYTAHAAEFNRTVPEKPLFWLKSPGSLLPHKGKIWIAYPEHRTDHEVELTIVIGKRCRDVPEKRAASVILGYTTAQDISDRHVQKLEPQWARAKSFDTYTPVGPWIDTAFKPAGQRIQMLLNGEPRQDLTLDQMIFSPARLVSDISQRLTLEPGDIILTGTPPGVGPIRSGDRLEARIEGLAPLINIVG